MNEFVPTLPLGEAPGPADNAAVRIAWRRQIDNWRGCRNYDYMRELCYWCLANDDQRFTDKGARSGTYKWCSERCRDTAAMEGAGV